MATAKTVKLFGSNQITVSATPIEAQYMERNKYYIKKGGKSVVKAMDITLNSKTVEVQYMDSGQKRKWPKNTMVYQVLDRDKMYRMKGKK